MQRIEDEGCTTIHSHCLQNAGSRSTFASKKVFTIKIGDTNMFTTVSMIVMLAVGAAFSIWMAKHDNLEVN